MNILIIVHAHNSILPQMNIFFLNILHYVKFGQDNIS